ncbi:sugar phosphate isomerase/epimerase family protein [Chryseolinea lacunae]|uniref:Sugar phosphate isomerase/epimerase n=1 Tax=Chryseolinea lacunae TaxID=2801331 RepID=A0ABS1KW10_9BACT|nr:sugar phosphate isomerase/epimerase [Chryseolinea lacunae]MBL0743651.1 sugar phosphate isomerase/epimerase [Chryseolinea lacunae]
MKRREFVQTASFAAVGLLSLPSFLAAGKATKTLGLQLYTLRDTIGKDPKGVLQKVASFGYKELEAYSYKDGQIFGMAYGEFNKFVKGLGMKVTSGHYGLDMIKGDTWQKAVEDAKKNGQEYMVVPYIQEPDRKTIDAYKQICADLNKAGEVCNKSGIRFGYHNHAFEFQTVDGQIPYDVMLAELDPKKVGLEMDLFWVINAGQDPLQYFAKYPGRFEQWHVKDMDKNDRGRNADVGTGSIDFKPIFAQAKLSGMKKWYVEQETYPGAPIDSAAASAKFLKTIL